MCRLLSYLGSSIQLDQLLYKPEYSLIKQSYQPREMTVALLNADGFGVGWYHPEKSVYPYTYKNILPIWNDTNLPQISRYVESKCILSYVRSATPGLAVDLGNCQPFTYENLMFLHNGFIINFRETLYRPIRKSLSDHIYQWIKGNTDSEHIFALILTELERQPTLSLDQAVAKVLMQLRDLALEYQVRIAINVTLSDGKQLIASRYTNYTPLPSLYWLRDDPNFADAVIIASEPIFDGNWNSFPENSILSVGEDLEVNIYPVS